MDDDDDDDDDDGDEWQDASSMFSLYDSMNKLKSTPSEYRLRTRLQTVIQPKGRTQMSMNLRYVCREPKPRFEAQQT
eukprot:1333445-Amphidinium_carterae.1